MKTGSKNKNKKNSTIDKSLVGKFIKLTKNQNLFPTISANLTIFAPHLSVWSFKYRYKRVSPSPYLVSMKKDRSPFVILSRTVMDVMVESMFERYWKNPRTLVNNRELLKNYLKIIKRIYLQCSYGYIKRAKLSNLTSIAKKVISINRHLNTLLIPTIVFEKELCEMLLHKLNTSIAPKRFEEIWSLASLPVYESFEKRRYLNILRLIIKEGNWDKIAERCQYYFASYALIFNLKKTREKLYKQYGRISVQAAKNLLEKERKQIREKISIYKNQLSSLNKKELRLADYIQEMITIRDLRKDGVSQALTVIYRIAQRLFKEIGLDEDLIYYCTSEEISKGIKYLIKNKKNIIKRAQGITILFIYNRSLPCKFEYGTYEDTKNKLEKYYMCQIKERSAEEIIGQAAYLGRIKGAVRIVRDPSNITDFKQGEILVTSMTRPEFIPLARKSGAIITDEGGITCHAAIVSRELKIPCIIGTKIATKVLKDGNLVEVDADKGVVRILEKQ